MKKQALLALAIMATLVAIAIPSAFAQVGTIRIEPYSEGYPDPIMLSSPATFNISVQPAADPTCDPHIFLVMTNSCYQGLTSDVTVDWTGDATPELTITTWHEEWNNSVKVPPEAGDNGYTVALLQSHLATSESIWWAFEPFLDGAMLTADKQEFTVTLDSTDPRMLVYALGKIAVGCPPTCPGPTAPFDNRVPPTQPGLVVPELATILLAAAPFGAFALYAFKRRKA